MLPMVKHPYKIGSQYDNTIDFTYKCRNGNHCMCAEFKTQCCVFFSYCIFYLSGEAASIAGEMDRNWTRTAVGKRNKRISHIKILKLAQFRRRLFTFKYTHKLFYLTWWMPISLDIRSIIIIFTSNLSVDVSSCLNNLSLKPVDQNLKHFIDLCLVLDAVHSSSWSQ